MLHQQRVASALARSWSTWLVVVESRVFPRSALAVSRSRIAWNPDTLGLGKWENCAAARIFPGERLNFNCWKLVSLVGWRAWYRKDRRFGPLVIQDRLCRTTELRCVGSVLCWRSVCWVYLPVESCWLILKRSTRGKIIIVVIREGSAIRGYSIYLAEHVWVKEESI